MRKCYLLILSSFVIFLQLLFFPIHSQAIEIDSSVDQLSAGSREQSFQQSRSCIEDSECDDQDPCTRETCYRVTPEEAEGICLSAGRVEDCPQNPPPPPVDCNDNDPCTLDQLEIDNICSHLEIEGCRMPSNEPTPPATIETVETPQESPQAPCEEKTENTLPQSTPVEEAPQTPALNNAPTTDNTMFGGGCSFTPSLSLPFSKFSYWMSIGIFLGMLWIKKNKIHQA